MKKILFCLIAAVIALGTLSGCTNGGKATPEKLMQVVQEMVDAGYYDKGSLDFEEYYNAEGKTLQNSDRKPILSNPEIALESEKYTAVMLTATLKAKDNMHKDNTSILTIFFDAENKAVAGDFYTAKKKEIVTEEELKKLNEFYNDYTDKYDVKQMK